MDHNHPQHAPARVQRRRGPVARTHTVAGESHDLGDAPIHYERIPASGAAIVDVPRSRQVVYHPYATSPRVYPQGRVHQQQHHALPASSSYYPIPGHMRMNPPDAQIPSTSPTSSATSVSAPGAPNSPGRVMMYSSNEYYPAQTGRMVSAVRDEHDDYQRPPHNGPFVPATSATTTSIGAMDGMRQHRHHSVDHMAYPVHPPQHHQQQHRRGYSLQDSALSYHSSTTTAPYPTQEVHFQQQPYLQHQGYGQPYAPYPPPVQQQWTSPDMHFQAVSLPQHHQRGSISHYTPDSAFPSPTQPFPPSPASNALTRREDMMARESMRLRERRDSIPPPPPTASSSSSLANSSRVAPMALPHHGDHSSSETFNVTGTSSLGISGVPNTMMPTLPTEASVEEHDTNANATAAAPTGGRREKRKDNRPHKCAICDKGFPRPSALETHMTVHSGAKPYSCPVNSCKKSFAVRSNARRHLKTHGIKLKTRERRASSTTVPTTATDASTSKGKKKSGPSLDKGRAYAGRHSNEEQEEDRDTSPNNDDAVESEEDEETGGAPPVFQASSTTTSTLPLLAEFGSNPTHTTYFSTGMHMQMPTPSAATSNLRSGMARTVTRTATRTRGITTHRGHPNVHAEHEPLGLGGAVETVPLQQFDILQPPTHSIHASPSVQRDDPPVNLANYDASLPRDEAPLYSEVSDGGEMTKKKRSTAHNVTLERRASRRKEKEQEAQSAATVASGSGGAGAGGRALRAQRQAKASARQTRGTGASSTHDAPVSRRDISSHAPSADVEFAAGTRSDTIHQSSLDAIEVINHAHSSSTHGDESRPYEIELEAGRARDAQSVMDDISESALRNLCSSRREHDPASMARAVPSSGEVILPAMDQGALDKLIAAPTRWKTFERQQSMRARLNEEMMNKGVATGDVSTTNVTNLAFGGSSGALDRMLEFAHADRDGLLPLRVHAQQDVGYPHTHTTPTAPHPPSTWSNIASVASNSHMGDMDTSAPVALDLTPPALVGTSSSNPDTLDKLSASPPEDEGGYARADGTWIPQSMEPFKNLDVLKNSSPFDFMNLSTIDLNVPLPAVQPRTPAFPGDKGEERDSFAPAIGLSPYHHTHFALRPVLPGPAPNTNPAARSFALRSVAVRSRPSSTMSLVA